MELLIKSNESVNSVFLNFRGVSPSFESDDLLSERRSPVTEVVYSDALISRELYGRDVKRMPKPSSNFAQSGVVVVNIMVDAAGNVTNATVGDGTTISDRATQQLALQAARQAKFTEGDTPQIGKITYTFKLN